MASDLGQGGRVGRKTVLEAHTTLRVNDDDRLAYFASFQAGFDRAASAVGGLIDHVYDIGGHSVRMRFAGGGPRFAPDAGFCASSLRFCCGCGSDDLPVGRECDRTDTPPPLFLSSLLYLLELRWFELLSSRREIKGYHGDRIRTMFHFGPNILSAMDMEENVAIYWIRDARNTPYYEKGYPLTKIFNWWTETRNLQCVHAAAVGTPEGGVLLAGKSGSGKSTTSLLCLNSELLYVSDDTSLVAWNPEPYAFSLYNTAKLMSFGLLPHLEGYVTNQQWRQREGSHVSTRPLSPQVGSRVPPEGDPAPERLGTAAYGSQGSVSLRSPENLGAEHDLPVGWIGPARADQDVAPRAASTLLPPRAGYRSSRDSRCDHEGGLKLAGSTPERLDGTPHAHRD